MEDENKTIEEQEKKKNERSLYRISTGLKAVFTPIGSGQTPPSVYRTNMIDLSGSGCKIKLSDLEMPETNLGIIQFILNGDEYKLYCEVVRRNANKRIVALKFTAPYESADPEEEKIPLAWIEEKIIQYIFEQQRYSKKYPHLERRKRA